MKIIMSLTKKHLMENKSRTIVTIMGIIISVAMITAVFTTVASFFDFFGKLGYISDGHCEVTYRMISKDTIEQLKSDERIDHVGVILEDETTSGYTLNEGTTMRARRGTMFTGDIVNLEQMVSCNYEGTLPKNSSEIAVEQSLLEANRLNLSIGDKLSMQLGNRTWINGDGKEEGYHGSYQSEEKFYPAGEETYTVTAILHGNKATGDFKILRGADDNDINNAEDGLLSATVSLKNVNFRSYKEILTIQKQYNIEHYRLNTEVLDAFFSLRKGSSFVALLPLLFFVMICIIAFSVILIYNAFGMSLAERVKYLGMLASVGATRAQKRWSVYYEGFLLGIIGIPIGIMAGLVGIAITLKIVGARILKSGMFLGIENTPNMAEIPMIIPVWLFPCIIIVGALTIFIAALVPAYKASQIMPIDAIRQTNEIKVKKKVFKVPKIVSVIFGYEGELAYKNLIRNGRKGKVIIFSIIASLVMFLGMNHFCKLFWESNNDVFNLPFSVFATASYQESDRLYNELIEVPNVEDVFGIDMLSYEYERGSEKSPNMEIMNPDNFTKAYRRVFKDQMTLMLHLVSDRDFIDLCQRQGIDYSPFFGNETNALLCNNVSYTENAKEAFSVSMIGQKLFYDEKKDNNPATVTIKEFVKWEDNPHIFGMYSKNTVLAIIPYSNYVKTVYGNQVPDNLCISYGIVTENHKEVLDEVTLILEDGRFHETYCEDVIGSQGTLSTILYVLEIFTYGFLTLITLITITNILNTVSTGVTQRRKEFAMLKSVGMTPRGFNKMIRLESSFYGIKATLWGIPISFLVCQVMTDILPTSGRISPNYGLFVIAVIVIFAIIWLSMLFSVSKLKKETIVEVLKEEIS